MRRNQSWSKIVEYGWTSARWAMDTTQPVFRYQRVANDYLYDSYPKTNKYLCWNESCWAHLHLIHTREWYITVIWPPHDRWHRIWFYKSLLGCPTLCIRRSLDFSTQSCSVIVKIRTLRRAYTMHLAPHRRGNRTWNFFARRSLWMGFMCLREATSQSPAIRYPRRERRVGETVSASDGLPTRPSSSDWSYTTKRKLWW